MVSSNRILTALLSITILYPPLLLSHGTGLEIERREATVIRLQHDDDTPMADANYELTASGEDQPYQTGHTDARGRVVFIPGDARQWHLRVFSQDGHGIDRRFELDAAAPRQSHGDDSIPGLAKAILGIGILLSGFGLMMLFVKRSKQ
jgi:nickel transport protein